MLGRIFAETNRYLLETPLVRWSPLFLPATVYCLLDFVPTGGLLDHPVTYYLCLRFVAAFLMSSTHRLVLLGSSSLHPLGIPSGIPRVLKFYLYSMALEIIMGVIALLFVLPAFYFSAYLLPANVSIIVGGFVATVVGSRLCLVLPATSVDQPQSFSSSWRRTSQSPWTSFGVFFLIPSALMLPALLVGQLEGPFFTALWSFGSTAILIIGVVYLSIYYRQLVASEHAV